MNQPHDRPIYNQQIEREIQDLVSRISQDIQSLVEKIVTSKLEALQSQQTPLTQQSNTSPTPTYTQSSSQQFSSQTILPIKSFDDRPIVAPSNQSSVTPDLIDLSKKYLEQAREQEKQNNFTEALTNYNTAIELNSSYAEAYFYRARIKHYKSQNYSEALADYDRSIELNPNYKYYCYRAYLQQYKFDNYPAALADYDRAIELNPNSPEAYYHRAYLQQYKFDNYPAALADYDRAIGLNPNDAPAIEQRHRLLAESQSHNPVPAYINDYNDRDRDFANIYQPTPIEREKNNYYQSRAGQTEDTILTANSKGDYWLFVWENNVYIVPDRKFKIREDILNEVMDLFDCENYQEYNYNNFTLVKPAAVSQQMDGNWRLKEKGVLQFG